MSGIAGIISWDDNAAGASSIEWMMRRIRHRGPQCLFWEARPPVVFGHALLALEQEELSHIQPLWLPDASCGIVADIHLHNREEVHRWLGEREWFRGKPSDAALLLAAYEQWGVELLNRIDGDFAFAIWDARCRWVFAARDPVGYPRVETLSATFGDLPCDESKYIEAVARQVPFRHHTFCPLDLGLTEGPAEAFWRVDSPFVSIERGLFSYCANILSAVGARTLLIGLGGDELVHEPYFLRDLARQKRYLRLFLESWKIGKNSGDDAVRLCFDAVRSSVPAAITHWSRRVRETVWQPPDWVTPTFRDFFRHCPEPPLLPRMGFRSLTQEATFQWLNSPAFGWFLEGMEVEGAYAGFAVRHPFLDRPLAEFVLAIPFEARLPEGQWKSLLRRSLAGDLPPEIAQRRQKTVFNAYHVHLLASSRTSLMETLFAANQWAAEPYIVRANALRLFQEFSGQNAATPWFVVETLWRIATLELWLRQLSRYQKMKKASIRTLPAWEGEAVAGAIDVASTKEIRSQTETHDCEERNGAVDVAGESLLYR